ncbi:MAG: TauD/TfdA family dioxygenase [Candidatus Doudnabacteria bacterium]
MKQPAASPELCASQVREQIDLVGFSIAEVGDRENYLTICGMLGCITGTRDLSIQPDKVERFTGYSYKPDEVPFHTDNPLVNIVGLFCVTPDAIGGENLLIDSRDILKELTEQERECLKQVRVPLPKKEECLPVLTEIDGRPPHVYWLPAFTLAMTAKLEKEYSEAVNRFDEVLQNHRAAKRCRSIRLNTGEALWFDNFVMLHGRDRLEASSKRAQVRVFIKYV